MTITEMRERRAKLWNSMESFLDTRRNENGCLSAEDDHAYASLEEDLDAMTNEIRRMERRHSLESYSRDGLRPPFYQLG